MIVSETTQGKNPQEVQRIGRGKIVEVHRGRRPQGFVVQEPAILHHALDEHVDHHGIVMVGEGNVKVRLPEFHGDAEQGETNHQAGAVQASFCPQGSCRFRRLGFDV